MAEQRLVLKALAGQEDLLFGRGTVNQSRGGATYPISRISTIHVVETTAELADLDSEKFPMVAVIAGTSFTLYEHTGTAYEAVTFNNKRSPYRGAMKLLSEAVTPIITTGVHTRVEGNTTLSGYSKGFTPAAGKLTYFGPADFFLATACITVREDNLDELEFAFAINGAIIPPFTFRMPRSTAQAPRTITFDQLLSLKSSDVIEVFVANLDDTNNLTAAHMSVTVAQ